MSKELKVAKQEVRPYLKHISDQALCDLGAMAKDGKIEYMEACKCIRGIVGGGTREGYGRENSAIALLAEGALADIGYLGTPIGRNEPDRNHTDYYRNVRLLPMVRAEMKRRDRVRQVGEICEAMVTR